MTVMRYRNWCSVTHQHELTTDENGPWVRYEDYEQQAMLAWRAEQRAAEMEERYDKLVIRFFEREAK